MERFLAVTTASSPSATTDGEELTEDNVFWTSTDFTERQPPPSTDYHNRRPSFSQSSGILAAALPEPNHYHILYRKPIVCSSTSSTVKAGTMIPQPTSTRDRECSRKFQQQNQSAPVNVPVLSVAVARERNKKFLVDEYYDEDGAQEMVLPPHEIVARGSGVSPKTTFSVLEGVGRTLKGRDLRQVRNAIFRKTGFLD